MASGGSKDAACGAWWPPDTRDAINRGAMWAFVRILALSRPCVMTWLYDGPLNKG